MGRDSVMKRPPVSNSVIVILSESKDLLFLGAGNSADHTRRLRLGYEADELPKMLKTRFGA
jgi:hypothetical protein